MPADNAILLEGNRLGRPRLHGFFQERRWSWGSVLAGLALWEIVSRFIVGSKLFLGAPSQIVLAMIYLARTGDLEEHI
jgi:ABC-type nitrate/sulfonate/bicarbonate transport system permease component